MTTVTGDARYRGVFVALVAAFFVDFLGYAFIVPILPSWQTQFDLNATQATLLVSLWAVPLFLFGPLTGRIVDRFGPAWTVGVSLVLLSCSALLYLVATSSAVGRPFTLLVIARLVHGASGAAVMTAGLAGASVLWPTRFGEQAGKLVGMAAIGGLLGPVIGGVLLSMVLMQGVGSVLWGRLVDRHGPTRYMMVGWGLSFLALLGVAIVGLALTDRPAVVGMIVMLGVFQFAIAAAQIPMLPVIDTATNRALGAGHLGLAFGAFGTAWAAGTMIGPLLVGPVFDLFGSWPIAIGAVALPTGVALAVTVRNRHLIEDCYLEEMNQRNPSPAGIQSGQ